MRAPRAGMVVVYPGSFDPVTFGHLDIVRRAAAQFARVTVAVVANPSKSPMFTLAERVAMLREACGSLRNVDIDSFEGLLVDYVRRFDRALIVKGLRIVSDFEHEFSMALLNKKLKGGAETIFMPASPEFAFVSSSSVKEVFALGGDVAEFVPQSVLRHMLARRRKRKR
jgi:pantetheine-phosphate adenylyltransferase